MSNLFLKRKTAIDTKNYYPKIKNSWQSNKENENSITTISINFQSALFLDSHLMNVWIVVMKSKLRLKTKKILSKIN